MTITVTPSRLAQGQRPNAEAAIYTCPANSKVIITSAVFTNTDTGAQTMTVYVVPSGGSALAATTVIDAQPMATLSAYVSPELANQVLAAADSIHGVASAAAKITYTRSGYLIVG